MFWEHYGHYAIGEFDNIPYVNSVRYTVTILKKNYNFRFNPITGYTDPVYSLLFAKDPVVIRTLNDDVFGVKGSEAILNILNKNGTLPLATFYAEEEDMFKVTINATYLDSGNVSQTKNVFTGFLVQEDSAEILTDITHEIRLTFTDNLGTLKNLPFGDAVKMSPTSAANLRSFTANLSAVVESTTTSGYIQLNTFSTQGNPSVGDYVVLNDSPIGDAAFTIIKIEDISGTRRIYVREKIQEFSNVNVNISYITGSNPYGRLKLSDLIRVCLHGTNMLLNFKFGNQAYAQTETQSIPYPLDLQIDGRTFLSGEDNWKSCYDVLQEICMRFQCAIYQSDGVWFMTRWNELRYTNNEIIHTNYNGYITNQFTTGTYLPNTIGQVEAGMEETILRPYNYYKETFKYNDTNQILFNSNLSLLGVKTGYSTETINSITYSYEEYEAPGFTTLMPGLAATFEVRIRVVKILSTGEEQERYLVVRYLSGTRDSYDLIYRATGIEVNTLTRMKITFDVREVRSTPAVSPQRLGIDVRYANGTNDFYFLCTTTDPDTGFREYKLGPPVNLPGLDRVAIGVSTAWTTKEFETENYPVNGLLYFYLGLDCTVNSPFQPNNERHYKNIKIELFNGLGAGSLLKGQEHKGYINKIVKNNENKDIIIDSTPKNSLYGTLFSSQFTNLVQNRVFTFRDGVSLFEGRLGELMTKQMMDWRYIQRVKLEGKILGIYKDSYEWLTLQQSLIFSVKAGKYFIFGKAVYNLKEDFIEATLYEMWKDGEATGAQGVGYNYLLDYDFKFLY